MMSVRSFSAHLCAQVAGIPPFHFPLLLSKTGGCLILQRFKTKYKASATKFSTLDFVVYSISHIFPVQNDAHLIESFICAPHSFWVIFGFT